MSEWVWLSSDVGKHPRGWVRFGRREDAIEESGYGIEADVRELVETANEAEALRERLQRAVHLAEHLFVMIPRQVWIDSGGDDGQGHYEGDYRAEQTRDEIAALKAAT